jgi:hypothetical protein
MNGGPPRPPQGSPPSRPAHFRAHERRAVRLPVRVIEQRSGLERPASVVDVSLAGAGLETEEPLFPHERIILAFATPTLWDPLLLNARVAWAHPPERSRQLDPLGRPRSVSRAGVAFEYPAPDAVLAMFEMLTSLGYE